MGRRCEPAAETLEYDVIVVGSGPASISAADDVANLKRPASSSADTAWDREARSDRRRGSTPLSAALHEMRADTWRLPAGARGTWHLERIEEDMLVVLAGAATLVLIVGALPSRP